MARRTVPPLITALFLAAIIGPATAVAQEPPPELELSVDQGPPGTVLALSGSGWPDSSVIDVTWQFTDVDLGEASITNGILAGTAAIPLPFPGGPGGIEVCVPSAGGEQCVRAFFSVTPVASVTPGSGPPGQIVEVTGEGWSGSSATVLWQPDGRELGQATIDERGTAFGQVQIPLELTEGAASIEVCVLDVDADTSAPAVGFEVTQPTVVIDPPRRCQERPSG